MIPEFDPDLELHRCGIGVLPSPGDPDPGTAISVLDPQSASVTRSCSCRQSRRKTCEHLLDLGRRLRDIGPPWPAGWDEEMRNHPWARILQAVAATRAAPLEAVRLVPTTDPERNLEAIVDANGQALAWLRVQNDAERRARQRLISDHPRSRLLDRLALFQLEDGERRLAELGMKTRRQTWEESLWYRLALHLVRDHASTELEVTVGQLQRRNQPVVAFLRSGDPILAVMPGRSSMKKLLATLGDMAPAFANLPQPLPLRSIFHAAEETILESGAREAADREALEILQRQGEAHLLGHPGTEARRWGDLLVVPGFEVLAEVEPARSTRRFKAPQTLKLERSRVVAVDLPAPLIDGQPVEEQEVARVLDRLRQIRLQAVRLEDGGWRLDADYSFGSVRVPLRRLLATLRRSEPFLETRAGWVDLGIESLRHLVHWVEQSELAEERAASDDGADFSIVATSAEILRLRGEAGVPIEVDESSQGLEGLLERATTADWEAPEGLLSNLRDYQALGTQWLSFLWDHRLSGLLCDDMGLGKTHQTMAWMLAVRERSPERRPFLVVAPTSVLPHWRDKIREHAPSLRARIHHGPDRDLQRALEDKIGVLLTSYGVLRNDQEKLSEVPFAAAIFDEIQFLKNRSTASHQAAISLDAQVKLGLTGTPIENALGDLKNLFDLILPGYLGTDRAFKVRYADGQGRPARLEELRRITFPFLLRRTKDAVLDELPSKIEDVRRCQLSADQLDLYQTAVLERANPLAETIAAGTAPIPYLHVFALLSHLKRICDHPALALDQVDHADRWSSGKWDLFCELLRESLDSGQKVVVFTQYLGMIELMERHLRELRVGHTSLTGSTRDRGERIRRFNEDSDCRVFLGSLKAGGTGIDLVGGSVVIHYDRWWNAAREDQATDRVHRIGQHRAVQVFKLVTENTLEERIHAIIERKRQLAADVVVADDAKLAKIFTTEQILELLRDPREMGFGGLPGMVPRSRT